MVEKRRCERVSITLPEEVIREVEKIHSKENRTRGAFEQLSKSQAYSMLIERGLRNGNR